MEKNKSEIEMAPKIPEKYLSDFSLIKQVKILATNEIVDVYQVTVFNECNRLASVFTSKEIFNGYDVEIVDKNKEILDVVKQMITDGQISQEVAEGYFPQLKKENEDEKIIQEIINVIWRDNLGLDKYTRRKFVDWLYKQRPTDLDSKNKEKLNIAIKCCERGGKNKIAEWLKSFKIDKKEGKGNPYSGVGFDWNNHHYGFCVRDNEINILIDGKTVGAYTPNFKPTEKNNWKPSQEQIKALEFLVRSYGESGTLSPYGETLAYSNSLLNDLKRL